jgi:RNA polymerase sigma factor (sigma-70 family)
VRYARLVGGDRSLAEDVAHDTLDRCLPIVRNLVDIDAAWNYLRRAARNRVVDARRRGVRMVPLADWERGEVPSAEEALLSRERLASLRKAVLDLGEPDATVLRGYYRDGSTYAEIALRVDLSEATVKRILGRVRLRLARSLADQEAEDGR